MFEVSWADPNVEKVGERKARKEQEQDANSGVSKRGSASTRRSSSAEKSMMTKSMVEKAPSIFASFRLKKKRLSSNKKDHPPLDLRIPIPEASTVTPSLPTTSTFCSTFSSADLLGAESSSSMAQMDTEHPLEPTGTPWDNWQNSQVQPPGGNHSSRPSILPAAYQCAEPIVWGSTQNQWPMSQSTSQKSAAGPRSHSRVTVEETFGRDLSITRTIETFVDVRRGTETNCAGTEVSISAKPALAPVTPTSLIFPDGDVSTSRFPLASKSRSALARSHPHTPRRARGSGSSAKTSRNPIPTSPRPKIAFGAHDPDRWRAPEEWDVATCVEEVPGFDLEGQFAAVDINVLGSTADLAGVQREIKKMSLLDPASILFHLEEKRANSSDPLAYRGKEIERKRLMLFALGALRGAHQGCRTSSAAQHPTKTSKILALFESEASASYLASVHPESTITHLSPSPLSPLLFPNVRPLLSPILSNSALSLAPSYFKAVHCLSLPSIVSSRDIPGVLGHIYRCLEPRGVLHLVLMDPAPSTSSLGPRLRQWIEDNLLLNLEREFRCTSPRKLFPLWLDKAGFRVGDGVSTITTIKCHLICPKQDKGEIDEVDQHEAHSRGGIKIADREHRAMNGDERTNLELRSRIGRMLWQEIWGSYVNKTRWWWDDPDCVKECEQLGTSWEYTILEAVKKVPAN